MRKLFPIKSKKFGDRLKALMIYNELNSLDLAAKLLGYSEKPKSNAPEYEECRVKDRTIKNHLKLDALDNQNSSESLSTIYLIEYCNFFHCEADFLLGYIDFPTRKTQSVNEITGLSFTTIEEISELTPSEKHIVDAIFSRSSISTDLIRTITEMLFYSHPAVKNNSYIQLDKGLTARDKDYDELEKEINEYQIIDILSQRLSFEMRGIIERLSKDEELTNEVLNDYKNKFFRRHRKSLTAAELPKFKTDDSGKLIIDIDDKIYRTEEKILERLENRDKKNKHFDYGIHNIHNYSDFKKCIQQYRLEKTKEEYISWLEYVDSETE